MPAVADPEVGVAKKKRGRPTTEIPTKPVRIPKDLMTKLEFLAWRQGTKAGKIIADIIGPSVDRRYADEKKKHAEE